MPCNPCTGTDTAEVDQFTRVWEIADSDLLDEDFPLFKPPAPQSAPSKKGVRSSSRPQRSRKPPRTDPPPTTKKNLKCEECDYKCARVSDLTKHKGRHHAVESSSDSSESSFEDEQLFPFQCNMCPYACSQKATLTKHVYSQHSGNGDGNPAPIKLAKPALPTSPAATSSNTNDPPLPNPDRVSTCRSDQSSHNTPPVTHESLFESFRQVMSQRLWG